MKHVKAIIATLAAILVALTGGLGLVVNQRAEAAAKRDEALADYKEYSAKKLECTGFANTTNSLVNSSGLTDCGGDLAVDAQLTVTSLYNIYHNYCYSGFGARVYGCYQPSTGRIYVCKPGTTLYDTKWRNWYSYYYVKYACNDANISNVIRHELLHVVYENLTYAEKTNVDAKLAVYKSQYSSQLSPYNYNERNGELFVRVGADGRQIDDIELVDLYSKVSRAYVAKKQSYYGSQMATADRYVNKYTELNRNYTIIMIVLIAMIGVNAIAITVAAVKGSKKKSYARERQWSVLDIRKEQKAKIEKPLSVLDMHKKPKTAKIKPERPMSVLDMYKTNKPPKPRSIFDMDFEEFNGCDEEEEFEELRAKIDEMGKKKRKTKTSNEESERKKFEDFKKKYGIIDVDEDEYVL